MTHDTKSLYIKGLDPSVTEADLKDAFERDINVKAVKKLGTSVALVYCESEEDATKGITLFDGSTVHGCQIQVEFKTIKPKNKSVQESGGRNCGESVERVDTGLSSSPEGSECSIDSQANRAHRNKRGNRGGSRGYARGGGSSQQRRGTGRGAGWDGGRGARWSGSRGGANRQTNEQKVVEVPPPPIPDQIEFHQQVRRFDLEKLRFLKSRRLTEHYETRYRLDIMVDLNNSKLQIKGHRPYVSEAFSELEQRTNTFEIKFTQISDEFRRCFRPIKIGDIVETFKTHKVYAGWDLRGDNLYICSDRIRDVETALELIRDMVIEAEYPAERQLTLSEIRAIVNTYQWNKIEQKLKDEDISKSLVIRYDESLKKLKFVLRSTGNKLAITHELDNYFSSQAPTEHRVSIPPELVSLVLKSKDLVLRHCSNDNVTINMDDLLSTNQCVFVSQSRENLENSLKKLEDILEKRCVTRVSSAKRGVIAWIKSQLGRDRLAEIDALSHTVSSVTMKQLKTATAFATNIQQPQSRSSDRSPVTPDMPTAPSSGHILSASQQYHGYNASTKSKSSSSSTGFLSSIIRYFGKGSSAASAAAGPSATGATSAQSGYAVTTVPTVPSISQFTVDTMPPELLLMVDVVQGNVATVQADGIVSSQGAIKESIERNSRTPVSAGYQQLAMKSGRILVVYHIHNMAHWNISALDGNIPVLRDFVIKAYERLKDVNVIAYPAIGTGRLGYPPDLVASTMIGTALNCLNTYHRHSKDKRVIFVIYPSDDLVFQAFNTELSRYQRMDNAVQMSHAVRPVVAPRTLSTEEVTVTFLGLKEDDVTKAANLLKEAFQRWIISCDWLKSPNKEAISRLTQDQVDKIQSLAKAKNVDITFKLSASDIKIEGLQEDVSSLSSEIQQILHEKSAAVSSGIPPHWDPEAVQKGEWKVKLSSRSEEYKRVAAKFKVDAGTYNSRVTISEITRVQNVQLYKQYEAQKEKVKKDLGERSSVELERELWHGTDRDSATKICTSEFNRSFHGRNAVAYGKGSYFATSSEYSIQYSAKTSQYVSDMYIILANVATGRFKLGNSSMDRTNLPKEYHSTVNRTESPPTIFVVYHDAAAYPAYLIRFSLQ